MELRLGVTPHGRLVCDCLSSADAPAATSQRATIGQQLSEKFDDSSAAVLFLLAGQSIQEPLPAEFVFWREWARGYFSRLSQLDENRLAELLSDSARRADEPAVAPADDLTLAVQIASAPPMRGLEYLTPAVLRQLWLHLDQFAREQASSLAGGYGELLRQLNPFRQLLGRVTFHLAENKTNEARPFAFLATYSHRMSAKAAVQHLPLSEALKQSVGERDQAKLAELLAPVRAAADRSSLIREWLDSRALFQPRTLSIAEAYRFLRDVPIMEESGLVVRVPNWWQARKQLRPAVQVHLGSKEPRNVGADGLLDFSVNVALDGERLTDEELEQLLSGKDDLRLLRGRWVEVNGEKLTQALAHWRTLKEENAGGIDFLRGMRLLAGTSLDKQDADEVAVEWSRLTAGEWLSEALARMRDPHSLDGCSPGEGLKATLRPYQRDGVKWLWFMTRLRLGACLADDMGLGKTIQVIDLLLRLRSERAAGESDERSASLLVVPASLIGNWKQELARFAPQLRVFFAHRSECSPELLARVAANPVQALAGYDLVVTTYTLVRKSDWVGQKEWRLAILDEAQAIKNSSSSQTKSVKQIRAAARIVLTGTPVENHLGDLWSLFDFCCPGLLGTASQFKAFVKRLNQRQDAEAYAALRKLVQPYILRRLKTDSTIVPDLPEKTEMRAECGLSKRQAALYQKLVQDLADQLKKMRERNESEGIQRRGIVLSTMMQLKQICNHPAQYLRQSEFTPTDSGKFARLAEICEPIGERQEKVLVFTQFQSLCEPLANFLTQCFGQRGLVLHGGVPVAKRQALVQQFQEDDRVPFFVISVKAGGTGLNLTAASHVVHFDRWWNPAVENQATDRAFRIGQKRNVLVHKFVCRGTLEERIDQMIQDKRELADKVLGPSSEGEVMLTEMSDQDLLNFVSLDITRAAD